MSSISGINSSDPQLYSLFQGASQTRQSCGCDQSSQTGDTTSTDSSQKIQGLQDKIDAAVSTTLQNLDKSTDARGVFQAIKTAVDGVLKDNGVDPSKVKHHHHHHRGGASDGGASGASGGGFRSHIDDLLRQNGFDPDQLRQQLASSLGSSGAATDSTAQVSGLAPGSSVDVTA